MCKVEKRKKSRINRHRRVRKKISGTADCPRLAVYRSLKHIYAQVIDDSRGITLVSASTLHDELKKQKDKKVDLARKVGEMVAERALEKGIKKVAFDRGGYIYHGRVKSLASGAREKGLAF
ncbi:MAG: 50S ribosomal protein L18 [bacterium]